METTIYRFRVVGFIPATVVYSGFTGIVEKRKWVGFSGLGALGFGV